MRESNTDPSLHSLLSSLPESPDYVWVWHTPSAKGYDAEYATIEPSRGKRGVMAFPTISDCQRHYWVTKGYAKFISITELSSWCRSHRHDVIWLMRNDRAAYSQSTSAVLR